MGLFPQQPKYNTPGEASSSDAEPGKTGILAGLGASLGFFPPPPKYNPPTPLPQPTPPPGPKAVTVTLEVTCPTFIDIPEVAGPSPGVRQTKRNDVTVPPGLGYIQAGGSSAVAVPPGMTRFRVAFMPGFPTMANTLPQAFICGTMEPSAAVVAPGVSQITVTPVWGRLEADAVAAGAVKAYMVVLFE